MNVVRLSPRRLAAPFADTAIGFFESLDDFIAINFGKNTPYRPASRGPGACVLAGWHGHRARLPLRNRYLLRRPRRQDNSQLDDAPPLPNVTRPTVLAHSI